MRYVEKYGRTRQDTNNDIIRRIRIACWLTTATVTPSEYVIFIAFPRKVWVRERASILHCTSIAYLVSPKFTSALKLCCLDRALFDLNSVLTSKTFYGCRNF